jgi:ABC-type lipoprotein export system ATPase subunit
VSGEILVMEKICKQFKKPDGTHLFSLKDVSLTVSAGEIVALMGRSGSGKSTVAHIAGLLMSADTGALSINGRDVARLSAKESAAFRCRHIGLVFQSSHLLPQFKAYRNVMVPAVMSFREARRAAEAALTAVGLGDRMASRPGQLSGGEQQRVALARAWINRPDLLIADEPTGNLDQDSEERLLRLFGQYAHEGRAVLVMTHSQQVADAADRVVVIESGSLTGHPGSLAGESGSPA